MDNVSVTYNIYKTFSRESIFNGDKVNTAQFLPSDSDEHYMETGKNNANFIISAHKKKSKKKLVNVAEIGVGDGRIATFISKYCDKLTCVDINPYVLEATKERFNKYGVTNAEFVLSDDFDEEDKFNLIYCCQVLQHNTKEGQIQIINQIKRALKPDGIAFIHLPKLENKATYVNCDTCMCFTIEQAKELGSYFSECEINEFDLIPEWDDYYLVCRK